MKTRPHRAWQIWRLPEDRYDEPGYVESYRDKGEAERKIQRLRRSHPYARYELRHKRAGEKHVFGTRGRERARGQRDHDWPKQRGRHRSAAKLGWRRHKSMRSLQRSITEDLSRRRDPGREIYISRSQNLAALIDNAYGHLTSREASGLMRAIDDADREGEDPRRAAIGYLRQIGVTVHVTESRDRARRRRARSGGRYSSRDAVRTHRGNADLIRWYLKHAHEVERGLFHGEHAAERRRKARATVARNVQVLRRVDRRKALGFVRSLGYRG